METASITKYKVNAHSRKFFVPKRIMNWILHLTVLFILQKLSINFFKLIHFEGISIQHIFAFFFAPFQLSMVFILNIFYFLIYYTDLPYFRKLKANNVPWPWEEDLAKFKKVLPDMVMTYMMNMFLLTPIFQNIVYTFWKVDISLENIPSFARFWITTWFCFIVEDFIFYWVHRLIHLPQFYWIHKKHHKNVNTFHLACVYTHWIEYIFGVAFPLLAGSMILQNHIHITTICAATAFRIIETHESHGGIEFEYSIFQIFPYMVDTSFHNFHHLKNMGNYGTYWILWDHLFKTDETFFKTVEITS